MTTSKCNLCSLFPVHPPSERSVKSICVVVYLLPENVQDFCVMPSNAKSVNIVWLVGIVLSYNVFRADKLWLYFICGGYYAFNHNSLHLGRISYLVGPVAIKIEFQYVCSYLPTPFSPRLRQYTNHPPISKRTTNKSPPKYKI